MNARKLAEKYKDEIIALRREFHQNPELSWQEFRTARRIEEELKKLGINTKKVAETGVVGLIEGKPGNKVVALRADMDALPIQENNEVPTHWRT